jgi:putative endonuclease
MSREKVPAVYILASKPYGTLYTGVTSDLCSRVQQHKQGLIPGFTKKYDVKLLVWFEYQNTMDLAIRREKNIKEWQRAWKIRLIEETNPHWLDRFAETCGRYIG